MHLLPEGLVGRTPAARSTFEESASRGQQGLLRIIGIAARQQHERGTVVELGIGRSKELAATLPAEYTRLIA